jgi:hypothetical protein
MGDFKSPYERSYQHPLNEDWPPNPAGIPDQAPIDVRAHIVWEVDGAEWVNGEACRWTRHHVFVKLDDPRLRAIGVWLRPHDVRRR